MDRRTTGVAVLGAAALLTVVAVAVSGRDTAGTAVAEPVRPAPVIGDCQLDSVVDHPGFGLPSRALGPCEGPRAGEVTLIFDDYAMAGVVTPGSPAPVDRCWEQGAAYLGLPDPATRPGEWSFRAAVGADLVGPDERQRESGQTWAACVVYRFGAAGEVVDFTGSAREVMLRAGSPDTAAMSWCADTPESFPLDCSTPHRVEILGTKVVAAVVPDEDLRSSCAAEVAGVTGMPDPTAGGALTVVGGMFPPVEGTWTQTQLSAFCAVEVTDPARSLRSTVRNIGSAPLPWT